MPDQPTRMFNGKYVDFTSIDAVLIDLDDTLVEYRASCIAGLANVCRIMPDLANIDLAVLEHDFRLILRDNLPSLLDRKLTLGQERKLRIKTLLARHGMDVDGELLEKIDGEFQTGFRSSRNVIEGAEDLLKYCRSMGIKVAVVTNGEESMQKAVLKKFSLDSYVDYLVTPASSTEIKPSRDIFERALSLTGSKPDRTLMIGDTYHRDVVGALNSGIIPVWLNRLGEAAEEDSRVIEVRSLKELGLENNGDGAPAR